MTDNEIDDSEATEDGTPVISTEPSDDNADLEATDVTPEDIEGDAAADEEEVESLPTETPEQS